MLEHYFPRGLLSIIQQDMYLGRQLLDPCPTSHLDFAWSGKNKMNICGGTELFLRSEDQTPANDKA